MSYGLQIFDSSGNLSFDSNVAAGGVCVGFFDVPSSGRVIDFPEFGTGRTGFFITPIGGAGNYYYSAVWSTTVDGYLRLTCAAAITAYKVLPFIS